MRPYLWLQLIGPNGREGPVRGLLDTGADSTSLPIGYRDLMGYTASNLKHLRVGQVSGAVSAWRATEPCRAYVLGADEISFQLKPIFVPGSQSVLWGRSDAMNAFAVLFEDVEQRFSLIVPPSASP